ncbi:hypothetical protein AKJ09_04421 [Labilithrix luteola]|uniref:PNPLA domain-containing protein n=1 Tax=Labilithrix luteola TaxID=1391654 RepID=A0A0K1PW68_9BACT|nr:patatin-like phospholipase family protein [Labilithrix luteola]AKU97757.1 hypothetical protein AKJ09_04421 [Labilithrix luteola]
MFDAVSFPGGGNRCYWQGGFWEAAAPALNISPKHVVGVSGGAFAAAYSLLGVGNEVRALVVDGCERGLPNFDWRGLSRGEAFPVASLYRELLDTILDAPALDAIKARAVDLQVVVSRPPRRWPPALAAAIGLGAYQLEKKLRSPVHPRWGTRLGFTPTHVSVRTLPDARAWADATFASACVPPIIGIQRIDGAPAMDGGFTDNVPVEPLRAIEAQGGRTLVLLTRRYATTPSIPNRVYVQPSEALDVSQFDITRPEAILRAYERGLRDGERFARTMR